MARTHNIPIHYIHARIEAARAEYARRCLNNDSLSEREVAALLAAELDTVLRQVDEDGQEEPEPPGPEDFGDTPREVVRAAALLKNFFESRGVLEWCFNGVADRRLVARLEQQISELTPSCAWIPGDQPPLLPATVVGLVRDPLKPVFVPVLVWHNKSSGLWQDNPLGGPGVPVEWWQYLPKK